MQLFFYGTLKRGHSRNWVLAGQTFIALVRTKPLYRLYDLGDFPGLVERAVGLSIEGELWDVDAACLARLDDLEGCDIGLYRRARVKLAFPHDDVAAMTFLYAQPVDGLPDCGTRWR